MAGLPQPGGQQRDQTKFIVFEAFEKMNTQSVRQALSEKELAWLENLQPIAPNNLTTVPAPASSPLATITQTISLMFYGSINGIDYLLVFTTAGSAYALNLGTGAIVSFANNGTFSTAPDVTVWQDQTFLINDSVAGYSSYNGMTFITQGGVSPNITITNGGGGYSSPPAVTISGGSGSGATAVASVANGSVVAITLTNPGSGYQAGDTLTVTIAAGSSGSGAAGHVTMTGFPVDGLIVTDPGQWTGTPADGTHPSLVFSGGGGSGASGIGVIVLNSVFQNTVGSANLITGGSGYTSPPTATFAVTGGPASPPLINTVLGTESVATIVLDAGGSGYVVAPSVSIEGGGGSGATATATIDGSGHVNGLTLTNAGGGYSNPPDVIIGSGGDTATATAHVWPFVPKGTTLAVFQGRVWLGGGTLLQYTGTQGYDDFDSANAAGSLEITDADLIHAITALRALNNYLWIMGDQSVKQIGNISLNAAGDETLFTILTLSSDQGTIYPKSCISYNRIFMFANANGIYGVFGSSVQKLSSDMDGIFELVDFSQQPQGSVADISAIHNAIFLVRYKDPLSSTRSIILAFDGRRWFVMSQGNSLVAIATSANLASGQYAVYGSQGQDTTNLLASRTTAVAFKYQTSLTHHGNAVQRKKIVRAGFAAALATGSGSVSMEMDTENGSQSYSVNVTAGFQSVAQTADGAGKYLGQTLTGTLAGFTITLSAIEFQEGPLWG
jgi:hypothetical protein